MKVLLIFILYIISGVQCYESNTLRILTIFPFHGKSHNIVLNSFVEALVRRGHNVTNISFFKPKQQMNNYRHISLTRTTKILEDEFILKTSYLSILRVMNFIVTSGNENCKILLENKEVQILLKTKTKFDLVIVEQFNTDCPLALAYKLEAPVVSISTMAIMPWHYSRLGIPYNPSFVPFLFLDGNSKATLYQRIERTILHAVFNVYYMVGQRTDEQSLQKYFNDIPPLDELARDIKFFLVYSSLMLSRSNLLPANVIEVGGLHVRKPEPLPNDLQKFIDDAEHGVIYISFGSVIKSSTIPVDKLDAIIGAMKNLPQRFIWKWETNITLMDKNKLYISRWLPQVDILAHSKTQAFFSHSGMGGTTEAIYFGIPMVAMPMFGDQAGNAAAIEESGLGVRIQADNLTMENLLSALKKVLNPKFQENVKLLSRAWRDRPMPPLDTAIYWTEFAARYSNFTFRAPSADVPLYQYLNLDIIFVYTLVILIIYFILKKLILIFCGRNKNVIDYSIRNGKITKKTTKSE